MALLSLPRAGAALAVLAVWLGTSSPVGAQPLPIEEEVKATFVFKFIPYVDWPDGTFEEGSGPFNLCTVAGAAFVTAMRQVLEGETAKGRPVQLVTALPPDPASDCHLLYVAAGQGAAGARALAAVQGAPVLGVGEGQRSLSQGAIIAFERDSNRIRFDISTAAAGRAGLTISSKLLRVARRVKSEEARR